jgi:uncharacterized protein YqgC (DUF456 family)
MTVADIAAALLIAVGLVGIVVPVLPGAVLVLAALVGWGLVESSAAGWLVVAVATACLVAAQILKYLVPGRRLRGVGVPNATLAAGALLGIVGFFVIPVVGLVVGFVVGVYAAERHRLRAHQPAVASTVVALRAVGISIAIELAGALLAAGVWLVGAVVI